LAETPTLFQWAGGADALSRLTETFYAHVREDPVLAPVFAQMSPEHPQHVALWLGEVLGGPPAYTERRGGYSHMLARHLGRALTEQQRARWVSLLCDSADEVGLPFDPEFRSAFVSYLEWGSRIAVANSQPGATPPHRMPVPHWDWGTAGPPPTAGAASQAAPEPQPPVSLPNGSPSFGRDVRPLFTDRDRRAMLWAFDLGDADSVRAHAAAILQQLEAGRMPCYGPWPQDRTALFRAWIEGGTQD
jgi:truncated hemoglobin YjbI